MNETTMLNEIHEAIEQGDALKRLRDNKDFQLVIEKLFLDGGAIQLAKNYSMVKTENRHILEEELMSRSQLYRFLMMIEEQGENAYEALKDLNSYEEDED